MRSGESVPSSGTGVTDGDEVPCDCRELNPESLQEHQVLLTTQSLLQHPDPPFPPHNGAFCIFRCAFSLLNFLEGLGEGFQFENVWINLG